MHLPDGHHWLSLPQVNTAAGEAQHGQLGLQIQLHVVERAGGHASLNQTGEVHQLGGDAGEGADPLVAVDHLHQPGRGPAEMRTQAGLDLGQHGGLGHDGHAVLLHLRRFHDQPGPTLRQPRLAFRHAGSQGGGGAGSDLGGFALGPRHQLAGGELGVAQQLAGFQLGHRQTGPCLHLGGRDHGRYLLSSIRQHRVTGLAGQVERGGQLVFQGVETF